MVWHSARPFRFASAATVTCSLRGVHSMEAGTTSGSRPDVVGWMMSSGGGSHAFPLMDFITSETDELDALADSVSQGLAQPCRGSCEDTAVSATGAPECGCEVVGRIAQVIARVGSSLAPNEEEEASVTEWLLQLDWFNLATQGGAEGAMLLRRLVDISTSKDRRSDALRRERGAWRTSAGAACDESNTDTDEMFIGKLHDALDGFDSLPLESNEFKWADFFWRYTRGVKFCVLGVATLFLVAGDVTAYAAGAVAGEHMTRVKRALLFAQGILRHYVWSEGVQHKDALRLDIIRTQWPLWRVFSSLVAELDLGKEVLASSAVRGEMPRSLHYSTPFAPLEAPLVDGRGDVYLSVIVQCRNDDYGGNMLLRLNRMLATATLMLYEARVSAEIIIVEWNPPAGAQPIADVIEREPGAATEAVPVRVIQVPPQVHMSMPHHKAHPLFEHTAENVAFRRARGRFVLKTNIDNIMSPDTVLFIGRQQLREDAVYRATYLEYDTDQPETDGMMSHSLLEWLFSREDLLNEANSQLRTLSSEYPEDAGVCAGGDDGERQEGEVRAARPFYWAGSGDFVLTSRALVFHIHGYPQVAQNWQTDDLIHCRLRAVGARQIVLLPPCATLHQNHRRINRVRSSTRWVITDHNFDEVCRSPFQPLPTETGLGDDWGFSRVQFDERVI